MEALSLYKKYHSDRGDERSGLFAKLVERYGVHNALYPGSFVHVTPSFFIPRVVYVDSFQDAKRFFAEPIVKNYVRRRKRYREEPEIVFYAQDYRKPLKEKVASFDLLISQYAGPVSQACGRYLKKGGLLVANNSHGDAGIAHCDPAFEFVAVYNRRTDAKYTVNEKDLSQYFIPKKKQSINRARLMRLGRGIGYTKTASGYIFRKK